MNNIENDNLERGLAEICRRESLTVASLALILPYCLLVIWPVYSRLGKDVTLPFFIPFVIFQIWLHMWVSKSRCPRCGQAVGHSPWGPYTWKCKGCNLEIRSPKWFGNKITFKKIDYIPGSNKTNKSVSA
jgi:hypothetical protein